MTRLADIVETEFAAAEIKTSLIGRKCWYGYTSVGNTFQIALGRKVLRDREELEARRRLAGRRAARGVASRSSDPLSREFERYRGEANLLVWCSWRLDGPRGPITSCDDDAGCEAGIRRLIGHTVRSVEIGDRWNLRLEFTGDLLLNVFPDHVGPAASFDGNWEVWKPKQAYLIGTDLNCEVLERGDESRRLVPAESRWRVAPRRMHKAARASA